MALHELESYAEVKALLRKTVPVTRRVYGQGHTITFKMRKVYTSALCNDAAATLDDLREAVTTLEVAERTARRVFGGAHPLTEGIEEELRDARAARRARETPPPLATG